MFRPHRSTLCVKDANVEMANVHCYLVDNAFKDCGVTEVNRIFGLAINLRKVATPANSPTQAAALSEQSQPTFQIPQNKRVLATSS